MPACFLNSFQVWLAKKCIVADFLLNYYDFQAKNVAIFTLFSMQKETLHSGSKVNIAAVRIKAENAPIRWQGFSNIWISKTWLKPHF